MVEQLTIQPFFDSLGHACAPHAPGVNSAATARMERVLVSPVDAPGRGILLRAPRAGFGKSHLLAYVQQRLGTTHEFLPLSPLDGSRIDAGGAIEAALRRLTRPLPAGGGLTGLDLLARRLFSVALQPLVSSGEVPCQDREVALSALRQRPVETFDFHHSQAVTAHWTKENFEVLGPRLALELSRRTGSSLNESSFWLASLFRFSVATPEHPGRTGMIIQSAVAEAGIERYAAFLALLSLIGRVVVVADDLEGMHADPPSALRFASFLASVRQEAPRVDLVVSVNDDIWDSAFKPALSGGLQDRIGELEIRLEPLDEAAMISLLETRAPGREASVRGHLGLVGDLYARLVLRKAAEIEDSLVSHDPTPRVVAVAAVEVSAPVAEAVVSPPVHEVVPVEVIEAKADDLAPAAPEVPANEAAVETTFSQAAPEHGFAVESPSVDFVEPEVSAPSSFVPTEEVSVEASSDRPASPFSAVETPESPEVEPVPTAGGDRIDDLLRQFRERYGRE
jgi:hypothetical protein